MKYPSLLGQLIICSVFVWALNEILAYFLKRFKE
jgi:hypothetical protein